MLEQAPRWLPILALAGLATLWGFSPERHAPADAWAQAVGARPVGASSSLLVLPLAAEAGAYPLVVVDSATRVMSVYHVHQGTGELSLKSVRNVHWDLQLEEFNSTVPTPREIRNLVERR
jgi:hypothetical protein